MKWLYIIHIGMELFEVP